MYSAVGVLDGCCYSVFMIILRPSPVTSLYGPTTVCTATSTGDGIVRRKVDNRWAEDTDGSQTEPDSLGVVSRMPRESKGRGGGNTTSCSPSSPCAPESLAQVM